jgi:hypothetical protein
MFHDYLEWRAGKLGGGMFDLTTLTGIHTVISLVALLFGFLALFELLGVGMPAFVTPVFVVLAFLTSATGFAFTFNGLLPSHIVGVLALIILAVAMYARYGRHLVGAWRWIYAAGMVASLYLIVFVGVAQTFNKVAYFNGLAPTQSEPPFAIAQLIVLAIFVAFGIAAARRFRPVGLSALMPTNIGS